MKKTAFAAVLLALAATSKGQKIDTSSMLEHRVNGVTVRSFREQFRPVEKLSVEHRAMLLAGKKTEAISLDQTPANVAEKTGRQVFAKIPGAFVYDMDGSGNQINVATRGLDPHRSWELNVRFDGALVNSDLYGYPASHFSPPLEGIERLEIVRGTAALAYGAAFGGMLNYVSRQPDSSKTVGFQAASSVGSFGLVSAWAQIGGRKGRVDWQASGQKRHSDGYRPNSESDFGAQMAAAEWRISEKMSLRASVARTAYVFQIPGPLTDSMFAADPKSSTRSRNFFNPDITVPALLFSWKMSEKSELTFSNSMILGSRNSVQFIGFADKKDAIDPATGLFAARQVDIDRFQSFTSELRFLHRYRIGKMPATVAAGTQFLANDLRRRQLGKGTRGSDFDLELTDPAWGRDLRHRTRNAAFFAENLVQILPSLSITPGFRLEKGFTQTSGKIVYIADEAKIPVRIERLFPLFGTSFLFKKAESWEVYGGWAQAFRPVIFADLIPATPLDRTADKLRDSRGENLELGFRGDFWDGKLHAHLTFFRVNVRDRVGSQAMADASGAAYILKTNVGDSRTDGLETYLEARLFRSDAASLSIFTATAWMNGRYLRGELAAGSQNIALEGKKIESVPDWTSRNGLQAHRKRWSLAVQHSFVAQTFSDPMNTVEPSANGTRGLVPSYQIWDAHLGWQALGRLRLRLSANNFLDKKYFTKRPAGYPGAGVWPSDGRGFVLSMAFSG